MNTLLLASVLLVQTPGILVKNNGEQIKLTDIEFFQEEEVASKTSLTCIYRGTKVVYEIAGLKRINIQDFLGREQGISSWKVLLVTLDDQKYELEMNLIKVSGMTQEGKEQTYAVGSINKISF